VTVRISRICFESFKKSFEKSRLNYEADAWTLYRSCLEFTGEDSCAEVGVSSVDAVQQRPDVHVSDVSTALRDRDDDSSEFDQLEVDAEQD